MMYAPAPCVSKSLEEGLIKNKGGLLLMVALFGAMLWLSSCADVNPSVLIPPLIIAPSQAVVLAGQSVQFTASGNPAAPSDLIWMVNGVTGGSSATGTISSNGLYTAPAAAPSASVSVTVRNGPEGPRSMPAFVQFFDPSNFNPGTVKASGNPLVALYSLSVPQGADVEIEFGQSTQYGLTTWAQPAPAEGGDVEILVAGMRASSTYHMRALVRLPNGTQVPDSDHSFTTGPLPAPVANITTQQTAGTSPAPGVELLCLDPTDGGKELTAVVTDLSGNVIWYYNIGPGEWPFPMKLLPNGHVLVLASPVTNSQGQVTPGPAGPNEIREIDLSGNVLQRVTPAEVDSALVSFGSSLQFSSFHHDVLMLPSGHYLILGNYEKTFANQPGLPAGTIVLGDALVDWDTQLGRPDWTWSTFDHLDPSRAPYGISNGFEDWTHSNALVYSQDDGDLLLSMRNQNWIVKIDYEDGVGDGSILWRFGYQGDFTLPASEAPIDWNYGQHNISIASPNSSGVFSLLFFNNGNDRLVDQNGDLCSTPGTVNCYSSVPIFTVNEYARTAQVQWEDNLSPAYSICCGGASILLNSDVEYDVAYDLNTPGTSYVQEVTQQQNPQLVWQMNISGPLAYRAFRIPSLYPGVVWTQTAIAVSETSSPQSASPGK